MLLISLSLSHYVLLRGPGGFNFFTSSLNESRSMMFLLNSVSRTQDSVLQLVCSLITLSRSLYSIGCYLFVLDFSIYLTARLSMPTSRQSACPRHSDVIEKESNLVIRVVIYLDEFSVRICKNETINH